MSEMKTRDSIQLSYGRYLDWKTQNPILLPGELACVLDDGSLQPIAIRFGNGLKAFNDLPSLPLVDTGDKYLSDERALVYTQEEVDEIKQALEGQIKTVDESLATLKNSTETLDSSLSEKMDETASSENKLLAYRNVLKEIENAITARFGRVLSSSESADGTAFATAEDLGSLPKYYQGVQVEPKKNDCANVAGAADIYIYNGTDWGIRVTEITPAQKATLDSGITSELVEKLKPIPEQIDDISQTAHNAEDAARAATATANEMATNVAYKIQESYFNTLTIKEGHKGLGYQKGMPITITDPKSNDGKPIHGFILSIGVDGTIDSDESEDMVDETSYVFLEYTKQQITEGEYEIVPDKEYAASVSETAIGIISSVKKTQDLWESQDYLKQLLNFRFSDVIHKGGSDGAIKGVRDGELTPLYSSGAVVYVDGDREEEGTGIEVDPYRSIEEAIDGITPGFSGTTIVINASKTPYHIVDKTIQSNVSFVGYAVGENATTTVTNFRLEKSGGAQVSVGFRDLAVTSGFNLTGFNTVFMDNVTINPGQTINLGNGGVVHMSHCSIGGPLTIIGGGGAACKVYLDCCTFSSGSSLIVQRNVEVFVEGCENISPTISEGCSYTHYSGTILGGKRAGNFTGAKLVALYSGAALRNDSSGNGSLLAGIQANNVTKLILGSFVFDLNNSDISGSGRIERDGIDAAQVVGPVYSRSDSVGYTVEGDNTIDAHLRAISKKLFALTGQSEPSEPGQQVGVVTSVSLKPGGVKGTLTLEYYLSNGDSREVRDVAVLGIKSAAYRNEEDFALTSDFNLTKQDVTSLRTTVGEHSSSIASLQSTIRDVPGQISTLQQNMQSVTSTAGEAKTEATKNSGRLDTLEGKVASLEEGAGSHGGATSEELQQLTARVKTLESSESSKEVTTNKSRTVGSDTSDHTKYPTVGAVLSAINALDSKFEQVANKVTDLGSSTSDTTHYPTVGAVNKGLETRIPLSRLPSTSDNSKIVTENSFRDLASQRTLIPNQEAHSNEDDVFGSIEIVKDPTTVYWDITSTVSSKVTSTQLQKGDLVSYFAYSLGGDTIKFAHNGAPASHSNVLTNPATDDYYLDIATYTSKVKTASADSETKNISDVIYKYSGSIWQVQAISGKEITSIAKSQGRAQWSGTAWAIISSPAQAFSREQMTAINSGIDSSLVDKLKGSGSGKSITDLTGTVYEEIVAKLAKGRVPIIDTGKSLLVAPVSDSANLGTREIEDSDAPGISGTDNQNKIPTVKSVRAIALAQAEATAEEKVSTLETTVANTYQEKIAVSHKDKVLIGGDSKGTVKSKAISTVGTDIESSPDNIPNNAAIKGYVEGIKGKLDSKDGEIERSLQTLQGTVSTQGSSIQSLKDAAEKHATRMEVWGQDTSPKDLKNFLAMFDENGHLVSSEKEVTAVTGTVPVATAHITHLADGVTFVPRAEGQEGMYYPVTTCGKRFFTNMTLKTADTYPPETDLWHYGAFLAIIHSTSDEPDKELAGSDETVTIANSIIPVTLDTFRGNGINGTKHFLRFVASKVFLYAGKVTGDNLYAYTDSASTYEFVDSDVYICLERKVTTNEQAFKGKFTRCTIHAFGNTVFREGTEFTSCTVVVHNAGVSLDFVLRHNVTGTMFVNVASTDPIEIEKKGENGTVVPTFFTSDANNKYNISTNILSTGATTEISGLRGALDSHTVDKLTLSQDEGETDTVKLAGPHIDENGAKITIDKVKNADNAGTAKNLSGGYISLSTKLGDATGSSLSAALTKTGVAVKLDLTSSKIGTNSLGDYLTGTVGVQNAATATACSGTAENAKKWTDSRAFKITDNAGTHSGTSVSVSGTADVTLKLPTTISAALNGNADTASGIKLSNAQTMTFESYSIQPTDWE